MEHPFSHIEKNNCESGIVPMAAERPCPVKSPRKTYKPPFGFSAIKLISPLKVDIEDIYCRILGQFFKFLSSEWDKT